MPLRSRVGLDEVTEPVLWRDAIAELLCSALLLVFLTFNQIEYFDWWQPPPTHVGLVMAFIVCVLVESFGHLGGAHMNPGVTLIMFCRGDISVIKGVVYLISQCCGAAAGSGIVYGLTPADHRGAFGPFQPAEALGPWRGMGLEVVISTLLFFTVLAVTDPARPSPCPLPGLPIGFAVGVDIMCAMSYTGAAMNPLIALGPAVITGHFKHHWIYWAGPLLGAVLAVLLYFGLTAVKDKRYEDADPDKEAMLRALQELLRQQRSCSKADGEKTQML